MSTGSSCWYTSCFDGNGRTSRAFLQRATRLALTGMDAQTERPYTATSCFDTTDAQTERPYTATSCFDATDAL